MIDIGNYFFLNKKIVLSRSKKEYQQSTPAWVRLYQFSISGISDMMLLQQMHSFLYTAISEKWNITSFIDKALSRLDEWNTTKNQTDIAALRDQKRLRCLYLTHKQIACGYRLFVENFSEPIYLYAYPAAKFTRQAGAKTKRIDHVKNEGVIKLLSDFDFWCSMNNEEDGGFGYPFMPFGFNSWMRVCLIDREKAESIGIIKPREKLKVPPELREKWCLPLERTEDYYDKKRLAVVEEMKKWGIADVRHKMLLVLT